ncbi:MAG: hypothetical protein ACLRZ7_09955 [Lachnospiraceae bacterium]
MAYSDNTAETIDYSEETAAQFTSSPVLTDKLTAVIAVATVVVTNSIEKAKEIIFFASQHGQRHLKKWLCHVGLK